MSTGGVEIQLCSFFILGAGWGGWTTTSLGRFTPGNKPVTIIEEVGWAGRFGQVRKSSPSLGFDARTVQPVGSRYTDCTIPAPNLLSA